MTLTAAGGVGGVKGTSEVETELNTRLSELNSTRQRRYLGSVPAPPRSY